MKYTNTCWQTVTLAVLFTVAIFDVHGQKKSDNPNIVYILADDMGYGDLSYLNKASKIKTPNMDKLAAKGIYFTDAHSNSAVCTPTRYGILTGRYAFRSSLKKGTLNGYSPSLIEPNRQTVATFLKENGYQTACIGKWHLGLGWVQENAARPIGNQKAEVTAAADLVDNVNYSASITSGPFSSGFDYSFIIPASLDMPPYCFIRNDMVVEAPTSATKSESEGIGRGSTRRPGKMSPNFDFQQVLPTFINESVEYINKQSAAKKPFFLYLPLPSPHTPWVPTPEFVKATGIGNYGDYVTETDYMIGRVVAALEKNGLVENTIVIVTSDNGSDWHPKDIEETQHRANYIFKGRKADIFEGGHRIPFLASWPGKIPAGTSSNQLMCTTDLFATVAALLNKELLQNVAEDSFNMLDAFMGKKANDPIRESVIHHSRNGFFAIRKGDWKLTTSLGSGGFSKPTALEPKTGEPLGTLYNIKVDPEEKNNLYEENLTIVRELEDLLNNYKEQGSSRPMSAKNRK